MYFLKNQYAVTAFVLLLIGFLFYPVSTQAQTGLSTIKSEINQASSTVSEAKETFSKFKGIFKQKKAVKTATTEPADLNKLKTIHKSVRLDEQGNPVIENVKANSIRPRQVRIE
ncbi:MAG TPA: hypothetical protein PKY82_33725 [Pyrinomonadaceae bacterium]|nr:hypothetical protein [Pyrinomonadaceae bacterium]